MSRAFVAKLIRGRCIVVLDDANAALAAIARAWPHATKLKFEPARHPKEATAVLRHLQRDPEWAPATLAGLLHIAERCPALRRALERLTAQSAALRPVARLLGTTSGSHPGSPRGFLSSQLAVIKDPQDCPVFGWEQGRSVRSAAEQDQGPFVYEDVHREWQQVAALVRHFVKVRAQERAWRAAQELAGVWEHAGAPASGVRRSARMHGCQACQASPTG
ncbi:hypothetical protein TRAPUB_11848 [Trametes pubescens]|uniref:Uncharacterized protein n=1 Tax=Trametes pubescens TaxID=154538 RepID=A0A1M2VVS6_TRAPU|nr:hypothetical protein TRAPUB_11848 [Trametes pubescens]